MTFYHVVSDIPKKVGQHFVLDEKHPNGVYDRVYAQMSTVEDIYQNPEKYKGVELTHNVDVALRELALERSERKSIRSIRPAWLHCMFPRHMRKLSGGVNILPALDVLFIVLPR